MNRTIISIEVQDNGGKDMAIMCIRKLLNDITERSYIKANVDYRVRDKQV